MKVAINKILGITITAWLVFLATGMAGSFETAERRESRHRQLVPVPFDLTNAPFRTFSVPLKMAAAEDLKISEAVSPATFYQRDLSLSVLSTGQTMAVWSDDRMGRVMIFRQRFDASGNPVGNNVMAMGREDGFDISDPRTISDGSGGYFLAWRDVATGTLYGARFDSQDNQAVAPFAINDIAGGAYAGPYDIAAIPGGGLAATWENYESGNSISLRLFSYFGMAISPEITVNDDGQDVSHWEPAIAVDPGLGSMAVVWEDYRNGNADIYLQFVNAEGTLFGDNLALVEAASDEFAQYLPDIAFASGENYLVTWLDNRGANQKTFMQRVGRSTGLMGANLSISDDAAADDWDNALTVTSTGRFVAAWVSDGVSDRVLLRRFGTGASSLDPLIVANTETEELRQETALCGDNAGRIYCGWSDYRGGNADVYGRRFNSDGTAVDAAEFIINDDDAGAHSFEPAAAVINDNLTGIVFTDTRFDAGDIFLQMVNSDAIPAGVNIKVNDDILAAVQKEPSLAHAGTGGILEIVWTDSRALEGVIAFRIFYRAYDTESGTFTSASYAVSDVDDFIPKGKPALAVAADRKMAAWINNPGSSSEIQARYFDGSTWAAIFTASLAGSEIQNDNLQVHVDNSGNYTLSYLSRGFSGGPSARLVRYNADGEFISRFGFDGGIAGVDITDLSTAVGSSGLIYLLWTGSDGKLYLAVLNANGTINHDNMEVSDNILADPGEPSISLSPSGLAITSWIDHRNGKAQAFYCVFDQNLNPLSANWLVSGYDASFMKSPVSGGDNARAWIAWVDPRAEGLDIFARRVDYTPTDVGDDDDNNLPGGFALGQNYPNPFNPSTIIEFTLPQRQRVSLTVYDLLGRKTAVLSDGVFEAGTHAVTWDGRDFTGARVASGLYLYRLKAGEGQSTRKMILLK